jgi:hypothetical protein
VGRDERYGRNLPALAHPDLSDELAGSRLRLQHDRNHRGREHTANGPKHACRLLHPGHEVASRGRERGYQQVAERVACELTGGKAMLERFGERRRLWQQRADATTEVTGGGNAEQLTEPTARTAVVGDRDHRRELKGILPSCPQRLGEPVAAPDRNHSRGATGRPSAHRLISR